ncbi:MAG: diaminopropionate ammonia-lyase [Bacillota bacterium]
MNSYIQWILNENKGNNNKYLKNFTDEKLSIVKNFHKSIPGYKPTPLYRLDNLSKKLNINNLYVKDESKRFGLKAFKALGATYAIFKYICKELNLDPKDTNFKTLKSLKNKGKLKDIIFVTATDGNHGKAVAWACNKLGFESFIFLPKGSSENRLNAIKDEGAYGEITDYNYDQTVCLAKKYASSHNGVVIQDTAWEGYEEIPLWIIQGYTTIMQEILDQIEKEKITHIFLQAGVGSFASAMVGYIVKNYLKNTPKIIIVEPDAADCIYKSAKEKERSIVKGDLDTLMAGLACGEPNIIAWDILKDFSDVYMSVSDELTKEGMKTLANPTSDDKKIISGESGAVGIGILKEILLDNPDKYNNLKDDLNLNFKSNVLVISTEGDTDPDIYQKIISE